MVDLHSDAFDVRLLPKWLLPSLAGASLVIFGLWGRSCYLRHEVQQHTQQADQSHAEVIAHTTEAAVFTAQVEARKPKLDANAKAVAKAQAETEAALEELARVRAESALAASDSEELSRSKDAAIVSLQVEVKAWAVKSGDLEVQLETVTRAYVAQTLALQDSGREALQLRAALAAQQGLTRNALWKGRLQGLAVGFATGYVAGRLN